MTDTTDRETRPGGFARFAAILRERYVAVVLAVIICGGAAYGGSLLVPPHYSATSQVAYSARDAQWASDALTSSGTAPLVHNLTSDAARLKTTALAGRVRKSLSIAMDAEELRSAIRVTSDPEAEVISVTAFGTDPMLVADIADGFAAAFVTVRQEELKESLAQAKDLVKSRMAALTDEEKASGKAAALEEQQQNLSSLLSLDIRDYEVLQNAVVPVSPDWPRPLMNLLIGLAAGLLIGLIIAWLLDYFDRRVKDPSTLEQIMELPVLATIGGAPNKRTRANAVRSDIGFSGHDEVFFEPIRMLRSNLKVLGFGDTKRTIIIASATPSEGKSWLAAELTLGMALAGDRVILVDADFGNPMIHQYFGMPLDHGLGDALLDRSTLWSSQAKSVDVHPFIVPEPAHTPVPADRQPAVSKFFCLTGGSLPANLTEILESDAWAGVLAELRGVSDYVIVSGPPLLTSPEALMLARSVDAVVLVTSLGMETVDEDMQVRQLLARAEIPVLGIVVCGAKRHRRRDHHGKA
jgi:Mrp family chromosome partitioning ATPase/capsular polysaccharide biosynthesis protein